MDSRSLNNLGRFLLVLVLALVAAGSAFAEPQYKKLKGQIPKLEKAVKQAQDERGEADQKLANNRAQQKRAKGPALAALKKAATGLAKTAGEKADALAKAQQELASKQGELRAAAASYAVSQLTAKGNLNVRVVEANHALDDWNGALGRLPDVPVLRGLDGIVDPLEQKAIRKQDEQGLKAYDAWAAAEEKRIDKEIKQAGQLVDAADKVSGADDGKLLVSTAGNLKKTLEQRKRKVQKLRKTAKDRLDSIN